MKSFLLFILAVLTLNTKGQTDLITNGSFEDSSSPWTGWSSSNSNGDLWAGQGSCSANTGTDYSWAGDQNENSGVNDLTENMYQQVTIPSNATAATLYFDASINTSEGGSTAYDFMEIYLANSSGTLLTSLGALDNTNGDGGISGCQTWAGFYSNISSSYFGSTIRVVFEFSTDGSLPTIFRVDDVELLVTTNNCTYSLSSSTYDLTTNAAGTYNDVSSVTTQSGCSWNAVVTSGNTWLTTTSSGNGNGNIDITVTENTTGSDRVGTIAVEGETLTVTQPALSCEYEINPAIFHCPDYLAGTHSNIAIVNVSDGCAWNADVVQGANWIVCNSDGNGSGTIDITVIENSSDTSRSGIIVVETETLLIVQPPDPWLTGTSSITPNTAFDVYPNPATEKITIEVSEEFSKASFAIIDLTGREILKGVLSGTKGTISLGVLRKGMYTIRLDNGQESTTKPFLRK